MIDDAQLREAFCEIGRRCWQRGYIASNDGNFSFRLERNRVLCTPTLVSKGFMQPDDMVVVDMEGNQLEGTRRLTSEIRAHLFLYSKRPDIYSVVHVHPPHATAFAVAQRGIPAEVLPEVEVNLGLVPLVPYMLTGTWEFARSLEPWADEHNAFLLENHGAITVGQDPFDAYYRMEVLDQACRILLLAAQAGGWKSLTAGAMKDILALKKRLGLADPRIPGSLASRPATFHPHPGPLTDEPKLGGTA